MKSLSTGIERAVLPFSPALAILGACSVALAAGFAILSNSSLALAFVVAVAYLVLLFARMELLLYGIVLVLVLAIDGWAPTRDPDEVIFRVGIGRVYVMEFAVYGMLVANLFKWLLSQGSSYSLRQFAPTPLDRPVLIFGMSLPVFGAYGLLRGNAFEAAMGYHEWRALFLAVAFYFLLIAVVRDFKIARRLLRWFVVLASIKAFYFIGLSLLGSEGPLSSVLGSGPVNEGPENTMFLFAALVAISFLGFGNAKDPRIQIFLLLATLALVANIAISQKRNSQLGLAVGLLVLIWFLPWRQRVKWTALGVTALLLCFLALPFLVEKFPLSSLKMSLGRYEEVPLFLQDTTRPSSIAGQTLFFHVYDWWDAWDSIKQQPLLGTGFGGEFQRYYTVRTYVGGEEVGTGLVHNQYLHFWLKTGLVGLGAFLWLLIRVLRTGYRCIQSAPSLEQKAMAAGLFAALCALQVMGMWGISWVANTKAPMLIFLSLAILGIFARSQQAPVRST